MMRKQFNNVSDYGSKDILNHVHPVRYEESMVELKPLSMFLENNNASTENPEIDGKH